ncbi:DUF6443 domain-containing protein [Chryseobacterium sp.]|jgi:RHS repeat-associated protein|uniref:DUF6443 domain-containing protein n=1 Tax=Chryseobacterium sp. TaxID=1871047 RepID=UPI002848F222|nr:DUF6443 domain-containing protein [Chryseobacterium sp.]MDR3023195.1 RHS repeat-associated core domain-containing protein [Chryseobacterium sp.]
MKKLIIPIGILIIGTAQAQLTNTENYVYSKTYLSDPTLANVKTSETVQYFDGLGRPKQNVNVKASPLGKDVVTPIKYDAFGRQVQDYLPVPQAGTLNGAITPDPLSNVSSTPYGAEKIYSEKILENSPLDRILGQKQVGTAWDNKPVQFGYDANADGEVKKYTATFNYTTFTASLTLSSSYGIGQLYKNTVTDEDGNSTIEFKNGQGQVLLVRKVISATENADTYYVYNDYNQLSYVIPPKASVEADPNTVLNDLCYQYKYDGRNRLVEKKLPGKGWEYMVYNKADQLILTQDTVLKDKGQWLFTKYDQFGRVIYTGITNNPASRASMQNSINANANLYETRTATAGWTLNGMPVYYTKISTPTGVSQVLSVNYYDTYPAGSPAVTNVFAQPLLTDNPANAQTTKGFLTASYVKNIEDDNWTRNFLWYDTKGRSIGSRSRNYLGGYTVINNKLDYTGVILQTNTYHKRLGSDPEKIIVEKFTYDSQNRLLTHTHQIGSNPVEYLSQNKYNELSQLESKKVGGIAAASPLQTVDYQYNIRGWMTKINDPANLNGKLFGYEIKYNNPVYTNTSTGRFNGNIAEIDWNISSAEGLKRYNYQYDALNRMLKGAYSQPNSSLAQNDYFNEELSYDLNGNIKTLKRLSWPAAGGTTAEKIDDLIYNYQNGDKSNVLDRITLPPGVINNRSGYDALQGTIAYNPNGNMTDHPDRKMKITYNYLNLPNNIAVNAGIIDKSTTSYIYRADGTKVSKVYDHNGPIETNYLDGFQYDNRHAYDTAASLYTIPVLKFVPTSEGYYDFTENKYIYNYTDHLGNVRVSYKNNGTALEVIDANNYYPFGLKHQESPIVPVPFAGVPYNYKYNGKELQETGMYDYGARFYMPDMGRWGVVDPLAEKMTRHSPYNYAFNNPIRFIDPDGRAPMPPDIITKILSKSVKTYSSGAQYVSRDLSMTMTLLIYNPEGLNLSKAGFKSQGVIGWNEFKGQASKTRANGKIQQEDNIKNLSIVYKVITDANEIKGTANVMTITSKDVYSKDGTNANGLTEGIGGQIGIVNYQGGDFKHTIFHELGHMLGLGEGYKQAGSPYPNENSNTIMDNNGLFNITAQQKADAAWVPLNVNEGNVYKASTPGNNPNFRRSSELKSAVESFNNANIR